mgnify:FL=1
MPLIAQGQPLAGLLRPEPLHQIEDPHRELQGAAAFFCFGPISKDPVLRSIQRRPADGHRVGVKIEITELEAAQLLPAVPAEQGQGEEYLPAQRGACQGVQKSLGLLQCNTASPPQSA